MVSAVGRFKDLLRRCKAAAAPLAVSGSAKVRMTAEKIGRSSFVLKYEIRDSENRLAGELRTVHVAVARETGEKTRLPEELRAELEAIK